MSRKRSDWALMMGLLTVAGLIAIGLMRFALFYRSDPQRTIFGTLLFVAFIWGLSTCILRRPSGLRLPPKGGRLLCGLLCAALLAYSWNAEGLTQDILILFVIMLAVVTMIYPVFSIFDSDAVGRTPKSPPRALLPQAADPKRKEPRKPFSKRAAQPRKRR